MSELKQQMIDDCPAVEVESWQLNRFIKRILQNLSDEQAARIFDLVAG